MRCNTPKRWATAMRSRSGGAASTMVTATLGRLPAKPGTPIPPGRLSLIVHMPEAIDFTQPAIAGLLIDEWVEVVPNATETTGGVSVQPAGFGRASGHSVAAHPNPVEQAFWTIPWLSRCCARRSAWCTCAPSPGATGRDLALSPGGVFRLQRGGPYDLNGLL